MALAHITDHAAIATGQLASQFGSSPNLQSLVSILAGRAQGIEDALWSITTDRPFGLASGDALGRWGAAVGMPRPSAGAGASWDSFTLTPSSPLAAGDTTTVTITGNYVVDGVITPITTSGSETASTTSASWQDVADLIAGQFGMLAATAPSFTATKTTDNSGYSIVSCAGSATVGTVAASGYELALNFTKSGSGPPYTESDFQWVWNVTETPASSQVYATWPAGQTITLDGGAAGVLTIQVDATPPDFSTYGLGNDTIFDLVDVVQNGTAISCQVKPGFQVTLAIATTGTNPPGWTVTETIDDSTFSGLVKAQIAENTSTGTPETLLGILRDLGASKVVWDEPGDYNVQAYVSGTLDVSDSAVAAILTAAAPPISMSVEGSGTFTFNSGPGWNVGTLGRRIL